MFLLPLRAGPGLTRRCYRPVGWRLPFSHWQNLTTKLRTIDKSLWPLAIDRSMNTQADPGSDERRTDGGAVCTYRTDICFCALRSQLRYSVFRKRPRKRNKNHDLALALARRHAHSCFRRGLQAWIDHGPRGVWFTAWFTLLKPPPSIQNPWSFRVAGTCSKTGQLCRAPPARCLFRIIAFSRR